MAQGLESAYAEDIRMRTSEEHLPRSGVALDVREFDADTTVFDEGGVRVTAFAVDHGGELRPAYGFRVSYGALAQAGSSSQRGCATRRDELNPRHDRGIRRGNGSHSAVAVQIRLEIAKSTIIAASDVGATAAHAAGVFGNVPNAIAAALTQATVSSARR